MKMKAAMKNALLLDLKKLSSRAFHMEEWIEQEVRRYHAVISKLKGDDAALLAKLHGWIFAPWSLWPCNIQNVMANCLAAFEQNKRPSPAHYLLVELLPPAPSDEVCELVAEHEKNVQRGIYENLIKTQAKFAQMKLTIENDAELQKQWGKIKAAFKVADFQDHKGVMRRTMGTERNLRPSFTVNPRRRSEVFRAVFDAFCLRWNLYGMKYDAPLLLKLSVNITPFGTMIHIPSYWSFDPKRDIHWDAIAQLHRARVPARQGAALADGLAERMLDARKLRQLDADARRQKLKGQMKHEFLCAGLGWVPGTSAKRISRLRAEFNDR